MEHPVQEREPYSSAWFKERALAGVREIEAGSWDYSDSLLLYIPGSDDEYEAVQETDTPYHRLVTRPEREYLEEIAPKVVEQLPDSFEYVDLGPGTEHKEQFIFDAAQEQGKRLLYRPVDISDKYLALSAEYATTQGISARPLKASFEQLPQMLGEMGDPRFVSLGLTYGNYDPSVILPLLKTLAGEDGSAFVNAQIRERSDMDTLREIYEGVAEAMAAAKIRLLGLDPEKDIARIDVTDEIKVWYALKHVSPILEEKGVRSGDRLLVFQSLRPTLDTLTADLGGAFPGYELLDTGTPFVGALLKN